MTSLIARIKAWFRKPPDRWLGIDVAGPSVSMAHYDAPKLMEDEREAIKKHFSPLMSRPSFNLHAIVRRDSKEPKMGTFQVFKDKSGQWRWRLRAANSRVIAQSESYTRKYDAVRAVQAIDRALKPGYFVDLPD